MGMFPRKCPVYWGRSDEGEEIGEYFDFSSDAVKRAGTQGVIPIAHLGFAAKLNSIAVGNR
jgi:hypothetical protein